MLNFCSVKVNKQLCLEVREGYNPFYFLFSSNEVVYQTTRFVSSLIFEYIMNYRLHMRISFLIRKMISISNINLEILLTSYLVSFFLSLLAVGNQNLIS